MKEENKSCESADGSDEESCGEDNILQDGSAGKGVQDDDEMKPVSPYQKYTCSKQMDDQILLELAKSKVNEAMEENQRLKMNLSRVLTDYRTLKTKYQDVIKQEAATTISIPADNTEELELISLGLGTSSSYDIKKHEPHKISSEEQVNEGLELGLNCKFEAPKLRSNLGHVNRLEEVKEEAGEMSTRHKSLKHVRNGGEDEILEQNPIKRARVSVRVRCDAPTMNDGCQWRKYGQKTAKGNPCPRSYYRCSISSSCPVRKQVQRCAEDMSILITTYEGTHNHPLPTSATVIASTTSAAASMLLSGSSTLGSGVSSPTTTTTTTANINGLNFYISDHNSRSKPFNLPNSPISSSTPFSTITLDLTTNSSSSSSSYLSRLANFPPTFLSTNLNSTSLDSNTLPISWTDGILSYATQASYNCKNQTPSSLTLGSQTNGTLLQSYLGKNIINPNQQSLAPDTVAAATNAITSNPSFQSALVAALSSIIVSNNLNPNASKDQNVSETSSQNIKSSEYFPMLSSFPSTPNSNKCMLPKFP